MSIFSKFRFRRNFLPGDFTIVTAGVFTYYSVCLSFPGLQAKFSLSISGLLIVMGKPIRNTYLGTVKHDWTPIVCYWANRKPFLLYVVIFEISKQHFTIKPHACWGANVAIEIYELLLLFSIITPCYNL